MGSQELRKHAGSCQELGCMEENVCPHVIVIGENDTDMANHSSQDNSEESYHPCN